MIVTVHIAALVAWAAASGYLGFICGIHVTDKLRQPEKRLHDRIMQHGKNILFRNKVTGLPISQVEMYIVNTNQPQQRFKLLISEDTDAKE